MTLKKTLQWSAIVFIVWFVAYRPDAAAKVIRGIGDIIAQLGTGFGDFFSRLIG
ncbi:hypothetical protein AB0M46_00555 [Dactylosporangium sp. NPDC051485]|uniref:hypothetical protein n=1 Tax=Dactylosporangium sp. NPDC051485 TaxID=3154846 RepID=UPI0034491CDF